MAEGPAAPPAPVHPQMSQRFLDSINDAKQHMSESMLHNVTMTRIPISDVGGPLDGNDGPGMILLLSLRLDFRSLHPDLKALVSLHLPLFPLSSALMLRYAARGGALHRTDFSMFFVLLACACLWSPVLLTWRRSRTSQLANAPAADSRREIPVSA